jgi:uncharacterized protein (DUF2126 family)
MRCDADSRGAPLHAALPGGGLDGHRETGRAGGPQLAADDVRLTMGGEPTFVSIDDMDGAQWNTEALGQEKQQLAETLIKGLRQKWAPGGPAALRPGQMVPGRIPAPLGLGLLLAQRRPAGVARRAVDGRRVQRLRFRRCRGPGLHRSPGRRPGGQPALYPRGYEDALYYLHKEQRLPVNVDPSDPRLDDPEARTRMAQAFQRGLGAVVGYVLPLQYGSWKSGPWPLRGDHMFLLPGDSPAGLRLPLESLPWVSKADFPYDIPSTPWPSGALPDLHAEQQSLQGRPAEKIGESVRSQPTL